MSKKKNMRYDTTDAYALAGFPVVQQMAANPDMHFDSAEDASVFFARELDYVKAQSYDVEYPELTALSLFPVSNEADPGAETITYYSYDKTGFAKIIENYSTDLPRADVKGKPTTAMIKSIGDSYGYSVQEMRASRMAGKSLDVRKAESARYAVSRTTNNIAWKGDDASGLIGVLTPNNGVPLYTIPQGAGGSTKWADKTADEIIADITGMLKQMAAATKKVERPDTLVLPSDAYIVIANKRIDGTDSTVLSYLEKNIKGITFKSASELDADSTETNPYAAASNGQGVALLYRNDKRKLSIEIPLPFIQYPPQQEGLETVVACEERCAGVMIYYPLSMLIAVGI